MWNTLAWSDSAGIQRCVVLLHGLGRRLRFVTTRLMVRAIKDGTAQVFHYADGSNEAVLAVYLRRRQLEHCICAALSENFSTSDSLDLLAGKAKEYMTNHLLDEVFAYWPRVGQDTKLVELRAKAEQAGLASFQEWALNGRFIVYRVTVSE